MYIHIYWLPRAPFSKWEFSKKLWHIYYVYIYIYIGCLKLLSMRLWVHIYTYIYKHICMYIKIETYILCTYIYIGCLEHLFMRLWVHIYTNIYINWDINIRYIYIHSLPRAPFHFSQVSLQPKVTHKMTIITASEASPLAAASNTYIFLGSLALSRFLWLVFWKFSQKSAHRQIYHIKWL